MLRPALLAFAASVLAISAAPASATGMMTCDSGPQSGWQSREALEKQLTMQGWTVKKSKVDGGCYEVYATKPDGARVEAYFHPVTFEKMLESQRGRVTYRKPG